MNIDPSSAALVRRLTAMRAGARISQAELGQRCGMTQSAVARLESLEQEPRYSQLAAYAQALGCSLVSDVQEGGLTRGMGEVAGPRLVIGEVPGGGPVSLSPLEVGTHVLVAGGTGSGRSALLSGGLVGAGLEAGMDVTVIDASGGISTGLVEQAAEESGVGFELLDEQSSAISEGLAAPARTASAFARDVVAACGIKDAYWAALSRRVLEDALELVGVAEQAGYAPASLEGVVEILSASTRIPAATKGARAAIEAAGLTPAHQFRSLSQLSDEDARAGRGAALAMEDLLGRSREAEWKLSPIPARGVLDRPGVQLVRTSRELRDGGRALLASLALHSVVNAARERAHRGEQRGRMVIVEGAELVGDEALAALLGWGRSSGVAAVVGVSAPSALRQRSSVISNVNVVVAMPTSNPADAEILSEWMGSAEVREVRQTILPGGEVSSEVLTRRSTAAVSPEDLHGLQVGHGFVHVSQPAERVERVKLRLS